MIWLDQLCQQTSLCHKLESVTSTKTGNQSLVDFCASQIPVYLNLLYWLFYLCPTVLSITVLHVVLTCLAFSLSWLLLYVLLVSLDWMRVFSKVCPKCLSSSHLSWVTLWQCRQDTNWSCRSWPGQMFYTKFYIINTNSVRLEQLNFGVSNLEWITKENWRRKSFYFQTNNQLIIQWKLTQIFFFLSSVPFSLGPPRMVCSMWIHKVMSGYIFYTIYF